MTSVSVACAMCGTEFDPAETSACASCPLGAGCTLACCPACGFSSVDVRGSRLARLATRLAGSAGRLRRAHAAAATSTLAAAASGESVRIERLEGLPAWQEHHLAAYGVVPGRCVDVVQTYPVVIVSSDNTEVAFERGLAQGVHVTRPQQSGSTDDVSAAVAERV